MDYFHFPHSVDNASNACKVYFSVLPAFSGNVPAALTYIFPSAKITRLGNW